MQIIYGAPSNGDQINLVWTNGSKGFVKNTYFDRDYNNSFFSSIDELVTLLNLYIWPTWIAQKTSPGIITISGTSVGDFGNYMGAEIQIGGASGMQVSNAGLGATYAALVQRFCQGGIDADHSQHTANQTNLVEFNVSGGEWGQILGKPAPGGSPALVFPVNTIDNIRGCDGANGSWGYDGNNGRVIIQLT